MFRKLLLIGYAASAMLLVAQELPVGTAQPVMLSSTIDTSKVNPRAPHQGAPHARCGPGFRSSHSRRRNRHGKHPRSGFSQGSFRLSSGIPV